MVAVLSTLRNNARMFPRFAAFVAVTYLAVGVAIVVGMPHWLFWPLPVIAGSLTTRILIAVAILAAIGGTDVLLYVLVARSSLFPRAQRAADILVNAQRVIEGEPRAQITEEPEPDEFEEEYEEEEDEDEPEPEPVEPTEPEEGEPRG